MHLTGLPPQAQAIGLALGGAAVVTAAVIGYRAWLRKRVSPEERERRRRRELVSHGKITDATLVEIRDDVLFYSYLVRGVEYTASQDVTKLKPYMPEEVGGLGECPVSVRYNSKNPANSIVLDEQWSGLHARKS